VATAAEAFAFAERIGYPLIVRSRERSGAIRVGAAGGMDAALGALGSGSVVIEQDAPGDHASYDAIAVGGAIAHEFVTHYDPSSLVATNRVDRAPAYRELRALGARVIELCGIETSAVHMAWVIGPRGAALRTVGCRPPGARLWDLYSAGNDLDLYREWALAVSGIRASQIASRRCAAGMVAVRPERAGHIAGYEGLEAIGNRFGEHLIDLHLPTPGTQVVPGAAGYLDHAWLRFKHTHDDALRRMLELVGRTVRMRVR
jgi:hypothetical protein